MKSASYTVCLFRVMEPWYGSAYVVSLYHLCTSAELINIPVVS